MSGEEVLESLSYWSFSTGGNWSHTKFLLIMVWWDPNPGFRVTEVKQCSAIPVYTGPAHMGVFLWSSPTGRDLRNATLWDMGPLMQCWQNFINTLTENLHIFNFFWSFFMYTLSHLQFSTHAVFFFFFGLWCFFFPPIVLLLAVHPPFLNNLNLPSLHMDHTHMPHLK